MTAQLKQSPSPDQSPRTGVRISLGLCHHLHSCNFRHEPTTIINIRIMMIQAGYQRRHGRQIKAIVGKLRGGGGGSIVKPCTFPMSRWRNTNQIQLEIQLTLGNTQYYNSKYHMLASIIPYQM